jgi:hypothetical protein
MQPFDLKISSPCSFADNADTKNRHKKITRIAPDVFMVQPSFEGIYDIFPSFKSRSFKFVSNLVNMRSTAMYPRTAKASGSGTDIVYKFRSIDDNLVGQYSVKL